MTWICLVGPLLLEDASGDLVLALRALPPSVDVSGLNHLDSAEINDADKITKAQRLVFHEQFASCPCMPRVT